MNRKEAERLTIQADTLRRLGFTADEAEALRRISMTLHRWHERECGDAGGRIERDEGTGRTYWLNSYTLRRHPIPDRETGAKRRLVDIIRQRNEREAQAGKLTTYVQTDPRGAALYILRPDDVPAGADPSSYYSRGICVY